MESAIHWETLLRRWPEEVPRRGILVTSYQESIPFVDFRLSTGIVLLERDKPDTAGARKVMLSFEWIAAIKFTDTVELDEYAILGFQPPGS